jgi:para-nitrobenzyl esterase
MPGPIREGLRKGGCIKVVLISLIVLCLAPISSLLLAADDAPTVRANSETIHGDWSKVADGIAVFRGIPYAQPPVGDLRWKSPNPHQPQPEPRQATQFAPACIQDSGNTDWHAGVAAAFGHGSEVAPRPAAISEDCLYLNVWTSKPDGTASLPVMVFVHGGSNRGGWSFEPNYLGDRLAARGVVVVTIAYRLGVFGFFSHPALEDGAAGAQANFGLLDIRAAFQWVRNNIRAFGGNPDNITAFGESAGALDIVDLMLVEAEGARAEKPLFRRLVSQSLGGSMTQRQNLAEARQSGEQLVTQIGLGPTVTAERLRQVSAFQLLQAARQVRGDGMPEGVIDGRLLQKTPATLAAAVGFEGVELLIGTNADEWLMYTDEATAWKDVEDWIQRHAPAAHEELLARVGEMTEPRRALDRLRTAWRMACPSRFLAEQVNAGGGKAWVYLFTRQRSGPGGEALGVYHGAELPYVFDTHDAWLPTEESDRRLTGEILQIWTRFAKTGSPTPAEDGTWPTFTAARPAVLELGDRVGLSDSREDDLCDVLGPAIHSPVNSND